MPPNWNPTAGSPLATSSISGCRRPHTTRRISGIIGFRCAYWKPFKVPQEPVFQPCGFVRSPTGSSRRRRSAHPRRAGVDTAAARLGVFRLLSPIAVKTQGVNGSLTQGRFRSDPRSLAPAGSSGLLLELRFSAHHPIRTDSAESVHSDPPDRDSPAPIAHAHLTRSSEKVGLGVRRRTCRRCSGAPRGEVHRLENCPYRVRPSDVRHDPQSSSRTFWALQSIDIEAPGQKLRPHSLRGLPRRQVGDLGLGDWHNLHLPR